MKIGHDCGHIQHIHEHGNAAPDARAGRREFVKLAALGAGTSLLGVAAAGIGGAPRARPTRC